MPGTATTARASLRAQLAAGQLIIAPGVFDGHLPPSLDRARSASAPPT